MRSRAYLSIPSWDEYLFALANRFGAEYDDPICELLNVIHTRSVIDFQEAFDRAMTKLNRDPNHTISVFL